MGWAPVLGAYHLALGSDAEDHLRLSAMMALAAGKLLALEGPYRLSRAVAYPTCRFLDQADRPFLAQGAHPSLALEVHPSLAQGAYPYQGKAAFLALAQEA